MTVQELIDLLADYEPGAEVRLGIQPTYPFQNSVSGVISAADVLAADRDTHDFDPDDEGASSVSDFDGPVDPETVYILEGTQLGYFSKEAWR